MRSRKRVAIFQSWELDATKTASIRPREIVLNLHHVDEEHHVEGEKDQKEDPEDPATPAPPERALWELPHKRIHACRNNQQRSCGKVGRARLHVEDRTTPAKRPSSVSFATSWDTWREIALNVGARGRSEQGLSVTHMGVAIV